MSQQMMLVSKEHILNVKRLYKIIFQLHKSLPTDLRQIGDVYVRSEFKLHKNVTPDHAAKFLNEWRNYAGTLARQLHPKYNKGLGIRLDEVQYNDFSDEQIQQLYELFQEVTRQNRIQSDKNKN